MERQAKLDSGASVRITYWAEQTGDHKLSNLDGIDTFRADLARDYVSVIHARPGELGGLLHLAVEFVSNIFHGRCCDIPCHWTGVRRHQSGPNALVPSSIP